MILKIENKCPDYNGYRAARVKSLFNAERGDTFCLSADIPTDGDWQIGLVVWPGIDCANSAPNMGAMTFKSKS